MGIYTIGYEGLDYQEFLRCLQRYQISVVADVRQRPVSRKRGFSKNSLSSLLYDNDIEYISFPKLGASKELRTELKETNDYHRFFKKYQEIPFVDGRLVFKSPPKGVDQLHEPCVSWFIKKIFQNSQNV